MLDWLPPEVTEWALLLLLLLPALCTVSYKAARTQKDPKDKPEGKRLEEERDKTEPDYEIQTSTRNAREYPAPPITPWNVVRSRPSAWLEKMQPLPVEKDKKKKKTKGRKKKAPKKWEHEHMAMGHERRLLLHARSGADVYASDSHYTNRRPPKLGYNHVYRDLLWSRFNQRGFGKMIRRWKSKPTMRYGKMVNTFARIRTLLVWDDVEMQKDLRLMAQRMLKGHRWMAIYDHRRESQDCPSILPNGYQIFRRHGPKGEGLEMLQKNFAKRTRERRWFSRMMDEREYELQKRIRAARKEFEKKKAEELDERKKKKMKFRAEDVTGAQCLHQWKDALRDREQMLETKIREEPGLKRYTLFRHVKARRRWGNSLFVYFGGNSILISTDELL